MELGWTTGYDEVCADALEPDGTSLPVGVRRLTIDAKVFFRCLETVSVIACRQQSCTPNVVGGTAVFYRLVEPMTCFPAQAFKYDVYFLSYPVHSFFCHWFVNLTSLSVLQDLAWNLSSLEEQVAR